MPGGLDETVRLDPDRLPYLPGKTASGLWRDAIELVVDALRRGDGRAGLAGWVDALCGSETHDPPAETRGAPRTPPRRSALAIRGARLRAPLARELAARPDLAAALRGAVPGVRINRSRGTADADMLRFVERARAGLRLVGEIALASGPTWTDRQRRFAEAILVAAASQLRHAGGDRRRGAGRCTVTLARAMPLADAVATLREVVEPPTTTQAGPPAAQPATDGTGSARLELTLACLLPVVATARTLGNIRRGPDHLPGTVLLAAVAGRLRRAGLDADGAIRRGRLLASDATPQVAGVRGLPVPRCLAAPKDRTGIPTGTVNVLHEQSAQPVAAVRRGYVVPGAAGSLPHYRAVPLAASTHNVIDDDPQRPTERVGGVYSHESIPAGTVLRAEVALPAEWAAAAADALAGQWRVGRASKDEYGRVQVSVAMSRTEPATMAVPPGGELVIWLTSTALVRDPWLEPVTDEPQLREAFAEALGGVRLDPPADRPAAVLAVDRRESWHTVWGLPRATLTGVAAGSVLRWTARDGVPAEALARLAAEGIGERRAEGFGRVAVNPLLLMGPTAGLPAPDQPESSVVTADEPASGHSELSEEEAALVSDLERVVVLAEIDRRAAAAGPYQVLAGGDGDNHRQAVDAVSRSQWGNVRDLVNQDATDLAKILTYLDQSMARRAAWRGADTVRDALRGLLTGDRVWRVLGLEDAVVARWRDDQQVFHYAVARTLDTALSRLRRPGSREVH